MSVLHVFAQISSNDAIDMACDVTKMSPMPVTLHNMCWANDCDTQSELCPNHINQFRMVIYLIAVCRNEYRMCSKNQKIAIELREIQRVQRTIITCEIVKAHGLMSSWLRYLQLEALVCLTRNSSNSYSNKFMNNRIRIRNKVFIICTEWLANNGRNLKY